MIRPLFASMLQRLKQLGLAILLIVVSATVPAFAQTAATDPVGVVKITIPASAPGNETAFTFKALGLARLVEFQGAATTDVTTGGNQIICAGAGWTQDQFNGANGKYYLEIVGASGTSGVGTIYDIASTDATSQTITLSQALQNTISGKPSFRIRKHWTIASVFGANNEAGLTSGTVVDADVLQIFVNGEYVSYYYDTSGFADPAWRKPGDLLTDCGGVALYPEDGIVIGRKHPTETTVTLMGAVKTGQTSFPILSGTSVLANPYAAPMTLDSSKLYTGNATTGLAPGSVAAYADQVMIFNGAEFDTYFYSNGDFLSPGWHKAGAGDVDQGPTVLPSGASFVVVRQSTAFNWVSPQHPSTF